MRHILMAYDVSMIDKSKRKDFLERMEVTHNVCYDYFESEGDYQSAKYFCIASYNTGINGNIVTRLVTIDNKETLTNWWGFKNFVYPAVMTDCNIGGL